MELAFAISEDGSEIQLILMLLYIHDKIPVYGIV